MGNVQFNYGGFCQMHNIALYTTQGHYVAGDKVEGQVYLAIIGQGFAVGREGVYIEIRGYERTRWRERYTERVPDGQNEDGSTKYKSVTKIANRYGKKSICRFRVPLMMGGMFLNPGQYQFPFALQLPDGLPGTFREVGRKNWSGLEFYDAEIAYEIKVEADASGMFNRDIVFKQPLICYEKLYQAIEPVTVDKTENVMCCCCFDKGPLRFKASFSKNAYAAAGDICEAVLEVWNMSVKPVTDLKAKFMRRLSLRAPLGGPGGSSYKSHTEELKRQVYKPAHGGDICPALPEDHPEGQPAPPGSRLTIEDGTAIRIQFPLEGQPETNSGYLVKCNYWVEMECNIDWCPDVEIHLDVPLYAPQPVWTPPVIPPNWQPQMQAAVQVAPGQQGYQDFGADDGYIPTFT